MRRPMGFAVAWGGWPVVRGSRLRSQRSPRTPGGGFGAAPRSGWVELEAQRAEDGPDPLLGPAPPTGTTPAGAAHPAPQKDNGRAESSRVRPRTVFSDLGQK